METAALALAAPAALAAPFFSEIHYNPSGGSETGREWVELHNPDATPVDLGGWVIRSTPTRAFTLPAGTMLDPGAYLVVAQAADLGSLACAITELAFGTSTTVPSLTNSAGASVELLDDMGTQVDLVAYIGGGFPSSTDGVSIAVVDVALGNDAPANWRSSDCQMGMLGDFATPGNPDQVCMGGPGPAPVCLPTPDAGPALDGSVAVDGAVPTDGAVTDAAGMDAGPLADASMDSDASMVDAGVIAAQPFFSEIYFDAPGTSDTNLEWMELHNPSDVAVDLTGWRIRTAVDRFYNLPAGTVLPPHDQILVAQTANLGGVLGCNVTSFTYGTAMALSNSGSITVELVDDQGAVVNAVSYLLSAFPNGVAGHSLMVTDLAAGNQDGANWEVADCVHGQRSYTNLGVVGSHGTPGLDNGLCQGSMVTVPCLPVPDAGGSSSSSGGPGDGGGGARDAAGLLVPLDAGATGNGAPQIVVSEPSAQTAGRLVTIAWSAQDPDGDVLSVSILRAPMGTGTSGDELFAALPAEGEQVWDTEGTPPGRYRLLVRADDGRGHVVTAEAPATVDVSADGNGGVITVDQPHGGEVLTGTFAIRVRSTTADGTLGVFYDTDSAGLDGTVIAGAIRARVGIQDVQWDTTTVPEGTYWVYAVVDGPQGRASAYSAGSVTVDRPGRCGCRTTLGAVEMEPVLSTGLLGLAWFVARGRRARAPRG